MNTLQILRALQVRFSPPEFAFLPNVANQTGIVRRRADGIAMGCWKSRGLFLHGFEIKASRADWLREKKNPAKADAIASYCDYFWLVIGDPSIVKLEELPATWGLLTAQGKRLIKKVEASRLETPDAMDRKFLAAICRAALTVHSDCVDRSEIAEELNAAREEGRESEAHADQYHLRGAVRRAEQAEAVIKEFENVTGVKMNMWDAGKITNAARLVASGQLENDIERVKRSFDNLADHVASLGNGTTAAKMNQDQQS